MFLWLSSRFRILCEILIYFYRKNNKLRTIASKMNMRVAEKYDFLQFF